jgi:hypothetical protein
MAGLYPWVPEKASIIQAMVWAFVFMSGAGMSRYTPRTCWIPFVNRRVMRWSSAWLKPVGSTSTPPLAPPKGRSRSAVFQVISDASARTSFRSAVGW